MRLFLCGHCGARLHFENTACLRCGRTVGFLAPEGELAALESAGDNGWRRDAGDNGQPLWRKCENYAVHGVCNWMIPAQGGASFCTACALNRVIPDLTRNGNQALWGKMETAKRRLVYTLLRLGLPVVPKSFDPAKGLAFEFLEDTVFDEDKKILTGHAEGVVTINLAEADDAVRERMRLDLREVYRTLLGHFRHESGHYYWDVLVRDDPRVEEVREVFGDEREDYAAALKRHYAREIPADWHEAYVTPYAAAHPWEDWAETWAHCLHILDTLETAAAQGLEIRSACGRVEIADPFERDFGGVLDDWHALRLLLNSLNRSMGLADAYPFVISPAVARKLHFVRQWVRARAGTPFAGGAFPLQQR